MNVVTLIRDWLGLTHAHDGQEDDRTALEAERRDVMMLLQRLDAAERRVNDREAPPKHDP